MSEDINKTIGFPDHKDNVRITEDVVASIAALAASEETGMISIAEDSGIRNNSKGVRITIEDFKVSAEIYITVRYGFSIPQVTSSVQEKIRNAIEVMTGLDVTNVNVHVTGIDIPQ